jgi:hypothetical protein
MYLRPFSDEEFLMAQTFDPTYDLTPIKGMSHNTYTTGKRQKVIDTALGNVLVPAVGAAIGGDAFNIPLPRLGNAQRTLNDFR